MRTDGDECPRGDSVTGSGLDGAVLLSGPALDNWATRALQRAVTELDLSITHVVINDATAASVAGSARRRESC
jgi:hypothetical protein